MADLVYAPDLSIADRLVLKRLENDILQQKQQHGTGKVGEDVDSESDLVSTSGTTTPTSLGSAAGTPASSVFSAPIRRRTTTTSKTVTSCEDEDHEIAGLKAMSDPKSDEFEPTVFVSWDLRDIKLHPTLDRYLLQPYVRFARSVARRPTDAVFVTHLLLYICISLPSAVYLFYNFHYLHGILHAAMQVWFAGTYTLMMHQHIHQRGVLAPKYRTFDTIFPYVTDTLHGHTWNSYYFHHVKHHHIEGNGPNDLSSTLRYQRDSKRDFAHYVFRFMLFIWLELPMYFFSKNRPGMAMKVLVCEVGNYAFYAFMAYMHFRATLFVFLLPLFVMRIGLMVGNWGQHALVHPDEPDSDYRSSITLIDVPSNRYCFNDGYHTSHHLNPLRHWRDHPAAFLEQRHKYAKEGALVFHNIDYLFMTIRLLQKDYLTLAKCLVPIGDEQVKMTMDERVAMLKSHTTRFTEEQIKAKFVKTA